MPKLHILGSSRPLAGRDGTGSHRRWVGYIYLHFEIDGQQGTTKTLQRFGCIDAVTDCQRYFAIDLPSCGLKRRQDKFILRCVSTVNGF